MTPPVGPIDVPITPGRVNPYRFPTQRPYKYGIIMLCLGAFINWFSLAENYVEPVRYIGIACIVTGTMLILAAMCCWMNSHVKAQARLDASNNIHVIDVNENSSPSVKPPDYESVTGAPPSYDVAIKLDPSHLLTDGQAQPAAPADRNNASPPSYAAASQLP